jgi:hypothetical protein
MLRAASRSTGTRVAVMSFRPARAVDVEQFTAAMIWLSALKIGTATDTSP